MSRDCLISSSSQHSQCSKLSVNVLSNWTERLVLWLSNFPVLLWQREERWHWRNLLSFYDLEGKEYILHPVLASVWFPIQRQTIQEKQKCPKQASIPINTQRHWLLANRECSFRLKTNWKTASSPRMMPFTHYTSAESPHRGHREAISSGPGSLTHSQSQNSTQTPWSTAACKRISLNHLREVWQVSNVRTLLQMSFAWSRRNCLHAIPSETQRIK